MDIKDFKNILFAKAKDEGFSEYEIYYSERKSFSVNIYKEQIEKYQNSETIARLRLFARSFEARCRTSLPTVLCLAIFMYGG